MSLIERAENLPYHPVAPLMGRAGLLETIKQNLFPQQAVLLYGASGVGKRSIAAAVALEHLNGGGQVLWIANDEVETLACRVLLAYQVKDASLSRAKQVLEKHQPLVVLVTKPETAAQFIRGYTLHQVPVLVLSDSAMDGPWEPVLVRRVDAESSRQFLMSAGNLPDTSELGRLVSYLDGQPLLLRLIATHLSQNVFNLSQLVKLLPPRELPEDRQAALLSTLFSHLGKPHQGLLLAISAGFSNELSAELLAKMLNLPQTEVEKLCHALVARGFLYQRKADSMLYYGIHPLIQRFGQTHLTPDQLTNARQRILNAVISYLNAHAKDTEEDQRALQLEMDTILSAAFHSQEQDYFEQADKIYRALSRVEALVNQCVYQARWQQFRQTHKLHPSKRDTQESQVIILPPEPEPFAAPPSPVYGKEMETSLSSSTDIIVRDELQIAYDDALARHDLPEMARLTMEIGQYLAEHDKADLALQRFAQAISLFQEIGDLERLLLALETASTYSLRVQGASEAQRYVTRGMNIAEQLGDEATRGRLLSILGDVRAALADGRGAVEAYKQAVKILRKEEDALYTGITLSKLAGLYMERRRYREATMALSRAVILLEESDRRDLMGRALGNLGTALGYLGHWREAGQRHAAAMRIARETGDMDEELFQLRNLAYVAENEEILKWAVNYNRQALYLALLRRNQELIGEIAAEIGRLLMKDPEGLAQAEVVLIQAVRYDPRPETQRLLDETRARLTRRRRDRLPVAPPEENLYSYAAAAYPTTTR